MTRHIRSTDQASLGDHGGGVVEFVFRMLWLFAVLLLASAILLGARSRRGDCVAAGTDRLASARVIGGGPVTRVGVEFAAGEHASHVVFVDPGGSEIFEITHYRDGHTSVRHDDRRGNQATFTCGPGGGTAFHMNRKDASPRIGPRSRGRFLEVHWQDDAPAATPGQLRVQGGRMSRETPAAR